MITSPKAILSLEASRKAQSPKSLRRTGAATASVSLPLSCSSHGVFGTILKFIDLLHLYAVSAGLKEEDTNDDESDSVRFNNEAMRKSVPVCFNIRWRARVTHLTP